MSSYLLQENGDKILQENGDGILLEQTFITTKGNTTFAVGDILRIKDGVDDEWMRVTNIASAPSYAVERDLAGVYTADNNPAWKKGASIVNYKQSGDGGIYMTASDSNAPYISIFDHAGSPWSTINTRMRMGNLNGYLGYATELYGVGIGSSAGTDANIVFDPTNGIRLRSGTTDKITLDNSGNVTATGTINATAGKFGTSTNYWSVGATGLTAVSASTDVVIKYGKTDFGQDSTDGFILGYDYSASKPKIEFGDSDTSLFKYDGTNFILTGGDISASDISGSTITGSTITTGTSGANINIELARFSQRNDTTELLYIEKAAWGVAEIGFNNTSGTNIFTIGPNTTADGYSILGFVAGYDMTFQCDGNYYFVFEDANGFLAPNTDNVNACGYGSSRWSDVQSVLINGADYGFEHNWYITENYKVGIEEKGIAFLDENNELKLFIGDTGLYVGSGNVKNLDNLPWVKTTLEHRRKMDIHRETRNRERDEDVYEIPDFKDAKKGGSIYKEKIVKLKANKESSIKKRLKH